MSRHCVHFLLHLCIAVLVCVCATSVVLACVQTGSPGSGVFLTNRCSGTQPTNSVGVVMAATSAQVGYDGLPLGYCSCPSVDAIDYVYPANPGNNPNDIAQTPFGPGLSCAVGGGTLCVCDEQGNCYRPYGTLGNQFGTADIEQAFFATLCDTGGCHMYTIIVCTTLTDPNSGLQNIVTGEQFPCSAQYNAAGQLKNVGTGSPYIRAYSISCRGCLNNPTCSGTFTTLPQHAQGR